MCFFFFFQDGERPNLHTFGTLSLGPAFWFTVSILPSLRHPSPSTRTHDPSSIRIRGRRVGPGTRRDKGEGFSDSDGVRRGNGTQDGTSTRWRRAPVSVQVLFYRIGSRPRYSPKECKNRNYDQPNGQ